MSKKRETNEDDPLDYLIDVEFAPLPKLRTKPGHTISAMTSNSDYLADESDAESDFEYKPIILSSPDKHQPTSDSGFASMSEVKTSTPKKEAKIENAVVPQIQCLDKSPIYTQPNRISFQLTVTGNAAKRINFDISDIQTV